uniref:hypothetical protein n=1 Tax=Salmonella sp. s51228 TaxID=3159652 RepID=UPI00397EC119
KEQGCTVGVDGTLFKKHPKFRKIMDTTINELLPDHKIRIVESEDGSGVGAAVIAAIAINP